MALSDVPPDLRARRPPWFLIREDGTWNNPDNNLFPGTAFCIVPPTQHHQAVYVTARHMVDTIRERQHAVPHLLVPRAISGEGANDLVAVPVDAASVADPPNDLALLRVNVQSAKEHIESDFPCAALALRPANIGENVLALGYPHQHVTESFLFECEFTASHCLVEDGAGQFRSAYIHGHRGFWWRHERRPGI